MIKIRRFFTATMSGYEDQHNVSTVPCKYKVGRVLGQGTYAVVKGLVTYIDNELMD